MSTRTWLCACLFLAGCGSEAAPQLAETGPSISWEEFRANPPVTWEAFRASVAREPDAPYRFVIDNDIATSDETVLRRHYETWLRQEYSETVPGGEALTVRNVMGADIIWHVPQNLGLTYCISNGFGTKKSTVISTMDRATRSWSEKIAVSFQYRSDQDATCNNTNANVVFNVTPIATTQFFADSFFPDSARRDRQLRIADAAFTTTAGGRDFEGILRHETGHILGFRHEHINLNNCTGESSADSRQVTSYDVNSVMHYPQCRPSGSGGYRQTALDFAGANILYGSYAFDGWSSVSEGHSATGGTVSVVSIGSGQFQLFLADPNGGVYTAWGSAQTGWTGWTLIPGRSAAIGSTVTAINNGGNLEIFIGEAGCGVFTNVGIRGSWSGWTSVREGCVAPGGTVSVASIGAGELQVFLSDPGGGIYTVWGNPTIGWSLWTWVPDHFAAPGSKITAVPLGDGRLQLFMGDTGGGVFTNVGVTSNWSGWTSVREGHVATGGTVTALPLGSGQFALFLADPNGGVYTSSGSGTSWNNWSSVANGRAAIGSEVTAVLSNAGRIWLYAGDPNGGIYTIEGTTSSWTGWTSVSQGSVGGAGTVSAAPIGDGRVALFLADPNGGVFTTSGVSERVF